MRLNYHSKSAPQMNKIFNRPAPSKQPDAPQSGVYLISAETNTFGFDVKVASEGRTAELTREDRQSLYSQRLNNMSLAARAKAVWADGGKPADIAKACRCSLSYAKKLSMCFGRAAAGSKFKNTPCKLSR